MTPAQPAAITRAHSSLVNLAEATRFVDYLAEGEAVTLQTFPDNPASRHGSLERVLHGSIEEHKTTLMRLNQAGAGIFAVINRTDGKGRKIENVTAVRAVFVDLDGAPLDPVLASGLEPHLVVESSPGRFHAYWLVSDCTLQQFKPMQKALARRFNGDPAVNDLPRVMRVPGFPHQKSTPFLTRILSSSNELPYRIDQVVDVLELDLVEPEKRNGAHHPGSEGTPDDWIGAMLAGENLHDSALHVVGRMVAKGIEVAVIRGVFQAMRPALVQARGSERVDALLGAELDRMIKGALDKGYDQPQQAIPVQDDAGEVTLVELSEDALAMAFAQKCKGHLVFDHTRGAWLFWNGYRWRLEETRLAFDWVRKFCRKMNTKMSQRWTKAAAFNAVELIARTDRSFAKTSADFDKDPWLLATPKGVIDLRTGELLPADPGLMITKCTAVEPGPVGQVPVRWLAFLDQATRGDQELIRFLQQVLGYALTGVTTEQMLVFVFGPGGNGKGVFINTVQKILADYAQTADMAVFTASRNDRHPTELAALKGARLVAASETERDRPWAESRVKQLTGGDRIRARFMRQDEFEFDPQFQLVIVGNHKPRLRAVDDAMRRRLNIVNFMHRPPVKNPNLEVELREEWPAILRWMVEGCLDWQRNGLIRPAVVIEATAEYLNEQDLLRAWIDECCEQGHQHQELAGTLFASWTAFAKLSGEEPGTQTAFGSELGRAGFNRRRAAGNRHAWAGLRLTPKPAQADPRSPREWESDPL